MIETINLSAGVKAIAKLLGNHTYTIYEDPSHAWIKVPVVELIALDIAGDITPYSYINGKYAYLEEDCDLTKFFNAYHAVTGRDPKHRTRMSDKSRVREYRRYTQEKAYASFTSGGVQ